ncbi:Cytochrome b-c1 complex, subunit 10 [Niveomyces insectorum RCEF 264]|uniref:Cytochrome b-c1 complex, subunit 10 n=1 Tax=Niveomyces insectorum RCEF 264 TaxID=1081102 RepID=A0A167YPM9_9HYPO|nr:Cytochrome b-c1 complex, subunit 10 [Niveomyces insectorum RCEF 264]
MRSVFQSEYRSQYGPKYQNQTNFRGITGKALFRFGRQTAPLGVAAAIGVLFYASGIPRVQRDILQKIPVIGGYFVKEVNPADSPF